MKKSVRIVLWFLAMCLIISFITFPNGDNLPDKIYYPLVKCSSALIVLFAISGLVAIYRLKRTGMKINVKVDKHTFYNMGVNNYRINYTVDNKTYTTRVSENDCRKEEVEILVSKKHPWIVLDKWQTSGTIIFCLILYIIAGIAMFVLHI